MSKKIKQLLMFLLIFALLFQIWSMSLYSYKSINYYREQIYHSYDSIDNLMVGASPIYCGFNTTLAEETTGESYFDLSTSSQSMEGSYYMLKDANEHSDIDNVYLQVSYKYFEPGMTSPMADEITLRYLRSITDQTEYAQNALCEDFYIEPLSIYGNTANSEKFSIKGVYYFLTNALVTLNKHYYLTEFSPYNDSNEDDSTPIYHKDGYVEYDTNMPYGSAKKSKLTWEYDNTSENPQINYLNEIIAYCKENDIHLTLISVPYNNVDYMRVNNIEDYETLMNDICAKNNLEYWDFNKVKSSVLSLDESDFRNENHLNSSGANKFTAVMCSLMKEQEADGTIDYDKYFYDTFAEKQYDYDRVLAVKGTVYYMSNYLVVIASAIANDKLPIEYSFKLYKNGELIETVPYSAKNSFSLQSDDVLGMTVKVLARKVGSAKDYEAYSQPYIMISNNFSNFNTDL